jgi:phosphoribosylglycinamide formyltransferase-1
MRIALLISGSGSTMEAILKACFNGLLPNVEPVLIISSNENAGGIIRARNLNFPEKDIVVIDRKKFESSEEFGNAILKECTARGVEFIGQYGWMLKTPDNVINAYKNKIVNQHPGPLDNGRPDFGGPGMFGMRVHQARLDFVQKTGHDFWTEATAHLVTPEFDKGEIVKRKQLAIFPNDSPESLQKNLLPIEHEVQIESLRDFSEGNVSFFTRETPLIAKGEEEILKECKEIAKKLYPHG